MSVALWCAAAAGLATIAFVWIWVFRLIRPGADFVVRIRDGQVKVRIRVGGRLSAARARSLQAFFSEEIAVGGNVLIRGYAVSDRRFRLTFSGSISSTDRQRVRNFLLSLAD